MKEDINRDIFKDCLYTHELQVATGLAREAGIAALTYYGKSLNIKYKGSVNDPVTEADRAANELIVTKLIETFPSDGIFSEESADNQERLNRRRVWIIDPIDGTRSFIAGNDEFAIQIGLAIDGKSILGVVFQPTKNVLYWAAHGCGAWISRFGTESARIHVSPINTLEQMRLVIGQSIRKSQLDIIVRSLGIAKELQRDSFGLKIGLIAEGQCEIYIHLSATTKKWDSCAPEAILQEAGGKLTDLWGDPLDYNSADVYNRYGAVATNNMIHSFILEKLRPIIGPKPTNF